jgi:hypothetical protein
MNWTAFLSPDSEVEEKFLDCAGRRVRGTNAEEKVGLLRSE